MRDLLGGSEKRLITSADSLVATLSDRLDAFLFSYSAKKKSLLSWSENTKEVLGVKEIEITRNGNLFLRHAHPEERYRLMTDLVAALRDKTPYRATYRWIRPDNNQMRWFHCRAAMRELEGEELFQGMILDISDQMQEQSNRAKSPDSIQAILAAFPALIFTVDRDLRLLRINHNIQLFGFNFGDDSFRPDNFLVGRLLLSAFGSKELQSSYRNIMSQLFDQQIDSYRTRIDTANSVFKLEIIPLLNDQLVEGLLFNVSDISEAVLIERQFAQLQKVEGLGLLAAGVAHNFNNSLQAILGHAAIVTNHYDKPEFVRRAGEAIVETVYKSSELTKQMMAFNDRESKAIIPLDLNLVSMAAINNLQKLFENNIKLSVSFGNPGKILANKTQLTEAIEGLILNAQESVLEKPEASRSLTIKSAQVELKELEVSDLKPGSYARLSVIDSGKGMSEESQTRCFEPFYTTKERDPSSGVGIRSPGLGLSRAFAIIRSLSGTITIDSRTGSGTTVNLYIPTQVQTGKSNLSVSTKNQLSPSILVIDDDRIVLETIGAMLKELDYHYLLCDDPTRAMQLINTHKRSLELLIVDAIMPGIDGLELLTRIRKTNQSLKILGFSGAGPEVTNKLLNAGAISILHKPIGPKDLGSAIASALGHGPSKQKKALS